MLRKEKKSKIWEILAEPVVCIILGIILAFSYWVFFSSMEAKTYNRLTGEHITTWEAMFVQLRIVHIVEKD